MKKVLGIILVISLSFTFLLINIEANSYNESYYLMSFRKYNIEKATGRNIYELNGIANDIIDYLKNKGGDELLEPHFNEREILHMKDVQDLFNLARLLKYLGLGVSLSIIFYLRKKKEYTFLGRTLIFGLLSNYIILGILVIMILTDFNKYFTYFHLILFTNDLWLLDPNTDLLIQMLPEEFFIGMSRNIGLSFFFSLAILQIAGYFDMKKGRAINEGTIKKDKIKVIRK